MAAEDALSISMHTAADTYSHRDLKEAEKDMEMGFMREDLLQKQRDLEKRQYMTVAITSICAILATVATIIEALACLTLQYCDGEDLMQFYWSFWAVLQIGSVIALIGLAVYHIYSLNDKDHPPWMIALGTPVLVIAGLGHIIVLGVLLALRSCTGRPATQPQACSRRTSYVRPQTPRAYAEVCRSASTMARRPNAYGASIMGFSSDGDVLIHFPNNEDRPVPPEGAELLGFDQASGAAIVKYPAPRSVVVPSESSPRAVTFDNQVHKQETSIHEQEPSPSSSPSVAAARHFSRSS
jgi:hypothetical protein